MTFTTFLNLRDETADAVVAFQAHADFRTIASFTLGWVFLLACRHAVHAPFARTLGHAFCASFHSGHESPVDAEKTVRSLSLMHMNLASDADVALSEDRVNGSAAQRFVTFLLFLSFAISGLTQFLSLLVFGRGLRFEGLCAVTLALGTGTSIFARVLGVLYLALELKRKFRAPIYELAVYGFLLVSVLGITGGTIYLGLGQVAVVPNLGAAICTKQHSMATSLTASLILITLETYTLARILFGLASVRGLLDIRVRRIIALIVFDLAILVPDAIQTNVLGDFVPFSVGAVLVLAAFSTTSSSICTPITLNSGKASTASPRSSVMQSSFFEPPQPMSMGQSNLSPALSERAMNNLLVNGPSYGGPTPAPRLSAQEQRQRQSLAPLPFSAKQLPRLPPAESIHTEGHDMDGPRSDVATVRSSWTRGANSVEDAVLMTATREPMPPGLTLAMPLPTPSTAAPRSGKILQPEQLSTYDRAMLSNPSSSSNINSAGLAPPPRSAKRPQLFVDTSGRKRESARKSKRNSRRVSFLEINSSSTPGAHLAPPPMPNISEAPAARERSKVSPANMVTMVPVGPRRSSPNATPRIVTARSPEAASSTYTTSARSAIPPSQPVSAPPLRNVPFVRHDETPVIYRAANASVAARKSIAETFGRRSIHREAIPDVPHTPTDIEPEDAAVHVPGPWVARPVPPMKLHRGPAGGVRGPRDRPIPPTSAPPM